MRHAVPLLMQLLGWEMDAVTPWRTLPLGRRYCITHKNDGIISYNHAVRRTHTLARDKVERLHPFLSTR